jgi:TetR/AcrR family transcriptional regulator, transcriptional repressor for nem operon
MPIKKITKSEILDISLDVFRKNGYHHTAMSDLATACNLQKGSFYHYFESKEVLMREVLQNTLTYLEKEIFPIADSTKLSPREKMESIIKKFSKAILMKEGGCIIGNMTMETALTVNEFKPILKQIFDGWINAMKIVYSTKFSEETSQRLAEQTVMEFEGAVMLSKIYSGDRFFRDCYNRVISRF